MRVITFSLIIQLIAMINFNLPSSSSSYCLSLFSLQTFTTIPTTVSTSYYLLQGIIVIKISYVNGGKQEELLSTSTNPDPSSLLVVAGEEGKAMLPCSIDHPNNDTIDLILWFRGEDETALYSLDARKGPIQRAQHFPNKDSSLSSSSSSPSSSLSPSIKSTSSSHAYIDISGRPPSLIIESVKLDDAGEYRCRIDFRKSRTQYRTVQLEVIIGPRDVVIMDEFGQRLRDLVGPFNEGAHMTLICEAEGGSPHPQLRWYKDGHLIDETWNITIQGIIRNELAINHIQRSDLMTTLTCIANNSNLTKPVSTSITLDLNLRPTKVHIMSPKHALSTDKRVELTCKSEGSRPPAIVTWWKGPKRLQHVSEDVTSSENVTVSIVHFTPIAEDNGKVLSCRADHSILPDSAIEDSWILDVYFAPKLSLSLGSNLYHDQVRESSDVTFECHVISNPPISYVSWQFNGRSFSNANQINNNNSPNEISSDLIIFRNHSLTIRNITHHRSGKYRCSAENVEGDGYSHEINLRILCKYIYLLLSLFSNIIYSRRKLKKKNSSELNFFSLP
ncbi:synaptogenesis protein syg-2-like [Panonychus citri]|uniref:synaptogenesis protein syg-2-like n=1 Tax=Panonychus citri TaxID=50023 RepID=UPI002306F7BB|nr:synaptogenesis protein syg-2-like [Panonychus citri]